MLLDSYHHAAIFKELKSVVKGEAEAWDWLFRLLSPSWQVRQNRMQLFPLFEDYDQVHHGAVSRQQFRRVLTELELAPLVPTEPEWAALSAKFHERVGGRDDVNYVGFCDAVYRLAQFEPRKP